MRIGILVAWAVLLAGPLFSPVVSLIAETAAWGKGREGGRLASVAANTAVLCAGTVALAVPVGWCVGLWAGRFAGPFLRGGLLIAALVPLPVHALAWQTVLGEWLTPRGGAGDAAWRPWSVGLTPAVWIHATAAVPWVAWAVAAAVRRSDGDLEDEAIQSGGVRTLVRRILLPRSLTAAVLAGAWVATQPLTEITVSDMLMVRSASEEVYLELVTDGANLSRAMAVAVPVWVAATCASLLAGRRLARFGFASADTSPVRPLLLTPLPRWSLAAAVAGLVTLLAVVPVAALLWKAGGGGADRGPEWTFLVAQFEAVWRSEHWVIVRSASAAVVVGLVTAYLAWVSCWAARTSPAVRVSLFLLCLLLLLEPGPVVGLGLKRYIAVLMDMEDAVWPHGPVWSLLYYQPTPLPAGWAALLRFFPVACVIVWPAVRAIPSDLLDAARMDGWGFSATWNRLVAPLTTSAFLTAAVAVAALALGEVSAGKLVNPAGYRVYILWLFDQMHYGTESMLAAMALVQLALTTAILSCAYALAARAERTLH